jgi:hypothetical protein
MRKILERNPDNPEVVQVLTSHEQRRAALGL